MVETTHSPLYHFRHLHCYNCPDRDWCKTSFEQHILCILSKIADTITRQQQLEQTCDAH